MNICYSRDKRQAIEGIVMDGKIYVLLGIAILAGLVALWGWRARQMFREDDAMEERLLQKFRRWDRRAFPPYKQLAELQRLFRRGRLPSYIFEVYDLEELRLLVEQHVAERDDLSALTKSERAAVALRRLEEAQENGEDPVKIIADLEEEKLIPLLIPFVVRRSPERLMDTLRAQAGNTAR